MESYQILYRTNNLYLVTIKTIYNVGQIIKKFESDILIGSNFNGEIVFDLLLSTTSLNSADRFWIFTIQDGKMDYTSKRYGELDTKFLEIMNQFFKNNKKLLSNSLLFNVDDF
ncbi:MAG: type II toxin-antitoxin system RnlB family antitoxin [Bacilli bacterium]|nr:type II toxin-antitoxin system RnlB family antitoxin [Bacilli bacterium]